MFLIAVGLLVGGAVNMQSAADDPRTPRVKTYDGYVDAWQSTHFDEYSGKYASTTPTISVARGASAGTGSTTTVSAWTKLEAGLAAIGLKDSRSDYKRHNKHFALYTEIANFHATGKKSEKKNEDVTLTIGSNTMKFHVTECDVTKHNRKKKVKNGKWRRGGGGRPLLDNRAHVPQPHQLRRINQRRQRRVHALAREMRRCMVAS